MNCKRCDNKLSGRQTSYCSPRCSKLHLKSLYKKRNKDKINSYNRKYKKLGIRGNPSKNGIIRRFCDRNDFCTKCGSKENLNACHINPRWNGGRNKDNLIRLCMKCHRKFDLILRDFWETK